MDRPRDQPAGDATTGRDERQLEPRVVLGAGQVILHYRVVDRIGEGGMGQVYKAEDLKLRRMVALKVLHLGADSDDAEVRKQQRALLREARSAASLNHPNIVTVHTIEDVNDISFLVMELIEGETLLALARRQRIPLALLVELGAQVADALGAAHAAGFVHRDIKPQNVLVTSSQQAKVLDFGLAMSIDQPPPRQSDIAGTHSHIASVTFRGVHGTIPYMSPEQTRGEPLDPRTDIFSLGATLYHLATRRLPFPGNSPEETIHNIVSSPTLRPSMLDPLLPPGLDIIIDTALAKDRERRYRSAAEFADALRQLAASLRVPEPPPARQEPARVGRGAELDAPRVSQEQTAASVDPRRGLGTWRRIGVPLLAAAGLAAALATRRPAAEWRPVMRPHLPVLDENSDGAFFSPDGRQLVFNSDRDGSNTHRLFIAPVAGGAGHAVSPPGLSLIRSRWSRDGKTVVGANLNGEIFELPVDGSAGRTLAQEVSPEFDVCGDALVITSEAVSDCRGCTALDRVDARGHRRELARFAPDRRVLSVRCDRSGRTLAWTEAGRDQLFGQQLRLMSLGHDGVPLGPPRTLPPGGERRYNTLTFAADGGSIVFASIPDGQLWEQPLDGGAPVQRTFDEGPNLTPDVSPDGKQLVFDIDQSSFPLYVRSLADGTVRRISAEVEFLLDVQPTRDGREVLARAQRLDANLVVAVDAGGQSERIITRGSRFALAPDDHTVFVAAAEDGRKLRAIDRAGGSAREVASFGGPIQMLSVADGIVHVTISTAAGTEAWRVPIAGGVPARDAEPPWCVVRPAPRGGWTALEDCSAGGPPNSSMHSSPRRVILVPPGGDLAHPAIVLDGSRAPRAWAPDGRSYIYRTPEGLRRRFLDGHDEKLFDTVLAMAVALAPDGKSVYYTTPLAHVRRQIISNWDERPRPWRK